MLNSKIDLQLCMENVEALTQGDVSPNDAVYIRVDDDCVYIAYAKAGSYVDVYAAGVKIASIKAGADGVARYIYGSGKTDCSLGGNHLCTARYCPQINF